MEWFSQFDLKPISDWLSGSGLRILVILLLCFLVYRVLKRTTSRVLRLAVRRGMEGKPESAVEKRAETLTRLCLKTGFVIIVLVAGFMILSELGINIAPVLAGVGVVGLAVGFGAQSLVRDIIAGAFILIENQYGVGDVVRIAGVAGSVEDINLRRTVLRDIDGVLHVVPNGEVKVSSNLTKEWARVNLDVSVGYSEDLDHVVAVLNSVGKTLAEDEYFGGLILTAPQALGVNAFGDSGVVIKILGETKSGKQWEVTRELRKRVKREFDKENIKLTWPHVQIYFGNQPPFVRGKRESEGEEG